MPGSIEACPGVYLRHDPVGAPVPVLVDVSRSGREYPNDFCSPIPFTVLHYNVSMYAEELCGAAPGLGATMLYACFPNTYVDTNRGAADVDERLIDGAWPGEIEQSDFTERGLGLIKRLSRYGDLQADRGLRGGQGGDGPSDRGSLPLRDHNRHITGRFQVWKSASYCRARRRRRRR